MYATTYLQTQQRCQTQNEKADVLIFAPYLKYNFWYLLAFRNKLLFADADIFYMKKNSLSCIFISCSFMPLLSYSLLDLLGALIEDNIQKMKIKRKYLYLISSFGY